jgi:hypothetical protein
LNRKVFLNFFAFLILLIFFSSLVFSATYTKKISDGTLTHNFDFNGRIAKRWSDNNAWVPSPAVDWNVAYHTYEGGRQLTRDNNLAGVWDSNLLVLWDMNDNASGTMLDSTGNGRSGTQNGITSVSGRWGTRGYGFNAGSSYVEADAKVSAFAGLSQGTISVWLKTTVNSATEMTFFSIGSTSITFGDFMVYSRGIR